MLSGRRGVRQPGLMLDCKGLADVSQKLLAKKQQHWKAP